MGVNITSLYSRKISPCYVGLNREFQERHVFHFMVSTEYKLCEVLVLLSSIQTVCDTYTLHTGSA